MVLGLSTCSTQGDCTARRGFSQQALTWAAYAAGTLPVKLLFEKSIVVI